MRVVAVGLRLLNNFGVALARAVLPVQSALISNEFRISGEFLLHFSYIKKFSTLPARLGLTARPLHEQADGDSGRKSPGLMCICR